MESRSPAKGSPHQSERCAPSMALGSGAAMGAGGDPRDYSKRLHGSFGLL